jgi:alkylhydroperoxidase/carboxymuconolactone decarboxylase family protein YurZ
VSAFLESGEIAAVLPRYARGYGRLWDVVAADGALPASVKALFMAGVAATQGREPTLRRELARAHALGLGAAEARGASIVLLNSRGEGVYEPFARCLDELYGPVAGAGGAPPADEPFRSAQEVLAGYRTGFDLSLAPLELLAEHAPGALEAYAAMRPAVLDDNVLEGRLVELLICAISGAEQQPDYVAIHAERARAAGATTAQLVETLLCGVPVGGWIAWFGGVGGLLDGASVRP